MVRNRIDLESKELLFKTIGELRSDEIIELVQSLLSSFEIKDIARRLMVAKLLNEDKTYEDIVETMGMSESTIGKIQAKTHGSPVIYKLFGSS